jgi:aryl-alcohol dehydrogenase-like predicted oxidoreductase
VSEELIGAALAGRARDYVLSTKTGEEFDAEAVASTYDFSRDATWRSLERSLKRLRTDRLDAVFVHCSAADLAIARDEGVLDALCEAQAQRMVGLVGFSGRTEAGFRAALDRCQVLMVEYSKAVPELRPVLDLALERGVGVVVKKGLASGKLPAGEALKFALGHEAVSSVVVGSLSLHHLEENLAHAREALLGNQ